MSQIPIAKETIDRIAAANKIQNPGKASIREMRKMIQDVEQDTGIRFVKMEMGIPGLPAPQVGVNAQIEALKSGVASIYPEIYGTADFKHEAARFVKNFLDIDVTPDCCVPTVGSMQAGFASFLTLTRYDAKKTKVLFIDPGFPVQKQQCRVLGIPMKAFDVYEYRGDKLRDKLEEELRDGDVACMIFSSPNNPAWFCFTDHELQIIGEMANKYGVVVMEDSAYFLMDFRKDYSVPGQAPFQPTVAKYTDLYVIMISGSKSFSYAGERIAMMVCSPKLFNMECPDLARYYSQTQLGRALIFGTLYCLSSGTAHSVQYAMAAMLKGANDGTFNFVKDIRQRLLHRLRQGHGRGHRRRLLLHLLLSRLRRCRAPQRTHPLWHQRHRPRHHGQPQAGHPRLRGPGAARPVPRPQRAPRGLPPRPSGEVRPP